jgi:hypothetical protein
MDAAVSGSNYRKAAITRCPPQVDTAGFKAVRPRRGGQVELAGFLRLYVLIALYKSYNIFKCLTGLLTDNVI